MSQERIVVLIDMDCFYCQVEEKLDPTLSNKPVAVVQYNPWKGGGIIAVNYAARAAGVTRGMRGDEAKEKCLEINLPSVPCVRGKADISKYREAGKEVAKVLQRFTPLLERASIDEAYLDITEQVVARKKEIDIKSINMDLIPNTFVLGFEDLNELISHTLDDDNHYNGLDINEEHCKNLIVGALLVSEVRAAVFRETGYQCSAGIAHNKILAKLVCGMNKPNKQTILPRQSIDLLYSTLSLKKVKHLGGKFGDNVCERLNISKMGQLQQFAEKELQRIFDEKNGSWLYNIARGIDNEPVLPRFNPKSIGCCKKFAGKNAIVDILVLKKWLRDLGDEIEERLESDSVENNRMPKQMVISFTTELQNGREVPSSRSYNFGNNDNINGELLASKAFEIFKANIDLDLNKDALKNNKLRMPIKFLGISVGKFEEIYDIKKTKKINDFFKQSINSDQSIENKSNLENKYLINKPINSLEKISVENHVIETSEKQKLSSKTILVSTSKENSWVNSSEEVYHNKPDSFFHKFLIHKAENNINNSCDKNNLANSMPLVNCIQPVNFNNVSPSKSVDLDSEDSRSTIDMEINKSKQLFDGSPESPKRIHQMRDLLSPSTKINRQHDGTCEEESSNSESKNNSNNDSNLELCKQDLTTETKESSTIVCPDCGESVCKTLIVMHSDYHFAMQMRDEDQITNYDKSQNSCKLPNTNTQMKNNKNHGITKFFPQTKPAEDMPYERCHLCNKKVLLTDLLEHLDFHEAQQLSKELNKRDSPVLCQSTSVIKRKRSNSPIKNGKKVGRSIDSFFR